MNINLLTSIYDANKQFNTPQRKNTKTESVYKSASKINSKNPLYITNNSTESKKSILNIKQNATELYNVLTKYDSTSLFDKKIAKSSNEGAVEVNFVDGASDDREFDIEIKNLAKGQVNIGSFLNNKKTPFPEGTHSININVDDSKYELQFYTKKNETNLDVQNRISRLINVAGIGLESSVIHDSRGYSALKISSKETGLSNKTEDGRRFTIYDEKDHVAGYLGLNKVNKEPENATIVINNTEQTSRTNTILINKTYEVKLKKEGESAQISTANNSETFVKHIIQMVNGINKFLDNINADKKEQGKKLINEEINKIFNNNEKLQEYGINKDGLYITLNFDKMSNIEDTTEATQALKKFSDELNDKLKNISLDPIKYIDKTIAAYKNPTAPSFDVYTKSSYSGMLLNVLC